MNNFQFTGKIEKILAEETLKDFKKRAFIVTHQEENQDKTFTHKVIFETWQDKIASLNGLSDGDQVTVHFNIKMNQWEKDGKTSYFTNLVAWKIEKQ